MRRSTKRLQHDSGNYVKSAWLCGSIRKEDTLVMQMSSLSNWLSHKALGERVSKASRLECCKIIRPIKAKGAAERRKTQKVQKKPQGAGGVSHSKGERSSKAFGKVSLETMWRSGLKIMTWELFLLRWKPRRREDEFCQSIDYSQKQHSKHKLRNTYFSE